MKFKNINIIERHVEKVVLAICVLVLLWVGYSYFVATPFQANVGNQMLGPREIDPMLADQARLIRDKLRRGQADEKLQQWKVPNYVRQMQQRIEQPVTPTNAFASLRASDELFLITQEDGSIGPTTSNNQMVAQYHTPIVPAPVGMVAQPNLGTLSELAVRTQPNLRQVVGGQPPYDLVWVSLASVFDATALRESLTRQATVSLMRIPETWWRQTLAISDVMVEREELLPDGQWGKPTLLPTPPDRPTYRTALANPGRAFREVVASIRQNQAQVVQPTGYELVDGRVWTAPAVTLPEEATTPPTEAPPALPPGMIEGLPPGMFGEEGMMNPSARPTLGGGAVDPASADKIELWAYDLTAKPGTQYRYRMRLAVVNPLFGKSLAGEQTAMAKQAQLLSPWSQWTEIETLRQRYIFLVNATRPPLNQAQMEIWQFTAGTWRTAKFVVSAGDQIGGQTTNHKPLVPPPPTHTMGPDDRAAPVADTPQPIDFATGTIMLDLDFRNAVRTGMIERNSPRLLYLNAEGDIRSRHLVEDLELKSTIEQMIIDANPEYRRLKEAEAAREAMEAERLRYERENMGPERPTRGTRRTTRPGEMPPRGDMMPPEPDYRR